MSEKAGGGALKTIGTFSTGIVVVAMVDEFVGVERCGRVDEECCDGRTEKS
jgi:hypothetical protein